MVVLSPGSDLLDRTEIDNLASDLTSGIEIDSHANMSEAAFS